MSDDIVPLPLERRRELFEEARPVVQTIVRRRCRKWPYLVRKSRLPLEDLIAIGEAELWHVSSSFDPHCGVKLATYAWRAIDGAIVDAIWAETRHQRAVREGGYGGLDQVGDDRERYGETSAETRQAAVEEFSDGRVAGMLLRLVAADPEASVMEKELHAKVHKAIAGLSEKDGRLIRMHYFEGRALEDAGAMLKISRSTVKRRHQGILVRLGARLRALGVEGR
jgi:RNA polymerase sigma factor for flagellar operon FliA